MLTNKQLEIHGCIFNTVATDAPSESIVLTEYSLFWTNSIQKYYSYKVHNWNLSYILTKKITQLFKGDLLWLSRQNKWYISTDLCPNIRKIILTLKQLGIFFKIQFYFLILFPINVIFLYKMVPCNGFLISTVGTDGLCFSTRTSVATVLSMHQCISGCLWVDKDKWNHGTRNGEPCQCNISIT